MKFNPLGGGANMNQMMKQAKKLQEEITKKQSELEDMVLETSVGGAITIKINGRQQFKEIMIKPEVVDPDDVEMLQDLILAAVNEAVKQSQDMVSSEMAKLTGGFNIPGL